MSAPWANNIATPAVATNGNASWEPENNDDSAQNVQSDHTTDSALKWCMENKEGILALHSSREQTKTFAVECEYCQRWYKHCMFSHRERKKDEPMCRWCQADCGIGTDAQQFEIDCHVHCNRSGKEECGGLQYPYSLELPAHRRHVPEMSIDEMVPAPEVGYTIQKKMSQKEKKAALRAGKANIKRGDTLREYLVT